MIEAVIFDMDGLLIDSETVTYKAYKETCARYNKQIDSAFYLPLIGTNAAYTEARFTQYFGDPQVAAKVVAETHEAIRLIFEKEGIPLKLGAVTLINYFKKQGMKLAVATSTSRFRAEPILKKCGIYEKFDTIVCGDEVAKSKPDPEIYLKAAIALGSEPSTTMVLEDSENGIIGAYAAGMTSVNVPDLKPPSEVVLEKAHYIAENLEAVIPWFENKREKGCM